MAVRMRTINEAIAEIRAADPNTALTPHGLRRLITGGKLPSVMIGKKYLVNIDTLEAYCHGTIPAQPEPEKAGVIRRIG